VSAPSTWPPERIAQIRPERLERNLTLVAQVVGAIHDDHPAGTKFRTEAVAVGEGRGGISQVGVHSDHHARLGEERRPRQCSQFSLFGCRLTALHHVWTSRSVSIRTPSCSSQRHNGPQVD